MAGANRNGLTIIELAVVLIILVVVAGLLLPAVRVSTDGARRMQCSNNVKQLALACHNYESAFKCFPNVSGGTGSEMGPMAGNCDRLSGFVALLPFLELAPLANRIGEEQSVGEITFPPGGPAPWVESYPPWTGQVFCLQCPHAELLGPDSISRISYAFSVGDVAENLRTPRVLRGAFAVGVYPKMEQYDDGTSNTVAIVEVGNRYSQRASDTFAVNQSLSFVRSPAVCKTLAVDGQYRADVIVSDLGRGGRWNDGASGLTLANTILPPNAASCSVSDEMGDGIYSAGSYHTGGINVAMMDGSVQFISEEIDCGDLTAPPPRFDDGLGDPNRRKSPYGVWGALGTSAGSESPSLE